MNEINKAIENNDKEAYDYYIDLFMRDMYSKFNSKAKVQGKTDKDI